MWPQVLLLIGFVFAILATAAKHKQYVQVNAPTSIVLNFIILFVLYMGGFFEVLL